ncbi:hypothetical protein EYF80_036815 [Liparis tanakae]|uniref:Uncharacterized protein n=1 Tax=Liparis tanakae TaxID=230148 RepID=A0A4Z2GHZ6_9TELE|nr:hypothetical protein EYF80_036815 [Liparis tanakae]
MEGEFIQTFNNVSNLERSPLTNDVVSLAWEKRPAWTLILTPASHDCDGFCHVESRSVETDGAVKGEEAQAAGSRRRRDECDAFRGGEVRQGRRGGIGFCGRRVAAGPTPGRPGYHGHESQRFNGQTAADTQRMTSFHESEAPDGNGRKTRPTDEERRRFTSRRGGSF